MAKTTGPDVIIHVLERMESLEQSMEAFEDGVTGAVTGLGGRVSMLSTHVNHLSVTVNKLGADVDKLGADVDKLGAGVTTLGEEFNSGFASVRKQTASVARALRIMAEHQHGRLDDHEARLKLLEDRLGD